MNINGVKGTKDFFGIQYRIYNNIKEKFTKIVMRYGAQYIQTSALDTAELFIRTAGADSDICQKEMFTVSYNCPVSDIKIKDTDTKTHVILKPEGTAPAIRALYDNQFIFRSFEACAYFDRMYRYSRPQRGRLREFTQAGMEFFGTDPLIDFQALESAVRFLSELGVLNQVTLKINTLGTLASRNKFISVLKKYFKENEDKFSVRHENPLRVLDKLSDKEKIALSDMPRLYDILSDEDKKYFDTVLKYLDKAGIDYVFDTSIIRGLDYYTHTVFEFCTSSTTAQNTVLAGGRYDNLIKQITKKQDCSAIGWGAGIERLMLLIDESWEKKENNIVYVLSLGEDEYSFDLVTLLRNKGLSVKFFNNIKMDKFLNRTNQDNVIKVIICGSDEVNKKQYSYKNMKLKTQDQLELNSLLNILLQS